MSKKEKTIKINCCDFCITEDCAIWVCLKCDRDACAECGKNWLLRSERPRTFNDSHMATMTMVSYSAPEYSGFICNDCQDAFEGAIQGKTFLLKGETRMVKV